MNFLEKEPDLLEEFRRGKPDVIIYRICLRVKDDWVERYVTKDKMLDFLDNAREILSKPGVELSMICREGDLTY